MSKEKGYCDVCSTEIEVTMCCSGHECGCMGLPTEPPICSEKCYDIFMSEEYRKEKEAEKSIAFFYTKALTAKLKLEYNEFGLGEVAEHKTSLELQMFKLK